ncbi:heterogeneous nuclear ribonucleoprotein K-like [Pogonomyrmex barbatus]|uniref:Heterogeneous nuclear ribonucleoprotein K-like n=1 Tax=Pogonomyrmex barbatus TaxID=144034 RepID=A0A6I9VZ01_9HYME|nr:heterogeneous nuclear ribonucleoprotein K-like [Pogonomyrmex barbatus]
MPWLPDTVRTCTYTNGARLLSVLNISRLSTRLSMLSAIFRFCVSRYLKATPPPAHPLCIRHCLSKFIVPILVLMHKTARSEHFISSTKTGARIKIYSNTCPRSTDRLISICGKPTTCIECIRELIATIKTSPLKGVNNPYDPHNFDDFYADDYGGYGSADGGQGKVGGFGGPGGRGGGGGGGGDWWRRRNATGDGDNRGGGPGDGWGMQGSAPNGLGGGGGNTGIGGPPMGGNNQGNQGNMSGNKTSTQVTIPKDLAGAIIGKGGARIRKIRSDSGAGITIDEPLPGSNDRIITITGIPSQIQMAQYLLQQSVHENADHY